MARSSVHKVCPCKDPLKCRHPWWFSYQYPGLPRLRRSLDSLGPHIDSKTNAEEEALRIRTAHDADTLSPVERARLKLPPSTTTSSTPPMPIAQTLTVRQLVTRYREAEPGGDAYQIDSLSRTVLTRLDGESAALGDWRLSDVTAEALERFRKARTVRTVRKTDTRTHRLGGPIAANRDLALLRAAWNWGILMLDLDRTPFKRLTEATIKLTPEKRRSRRLQTGEGDALLAAIRGTHLRAVVEAALETGCRRGELLGLQWRDVDLVRRALTLPAAKTKTATPRTVPISTRLAAVLAMRRNDLKGEPLPPDAFVLGDEAGRPLISIKTAWRLSCKRARITGLRFHDLRREAGSRWMDAGVPMGTIQRWLGHANVSQTSTYLETTTVGEYEAMRRFDERMGRLTPIDADSSTPPPQRPSIDQDVIEKTQENTTKH
jgi:integrase